MVSPTGIPPKGTARCPTPGDGSALRGTTRHSLHRGDHSDELPVNCRTPARAEYDGTTDLQEHLSRFENAALLHRYTDGINRKHRKTELSLFSIRQKEEESLKDYLLRFNTAALEVPSTIQEFKASTFVQGLMDGDFFKLLAKKPATKFDVLLARAAKYINMEDAQASKREGRGEKRKENKDENPSKKPRMDFKDKKPAWQKVNMVYTPLIVPIIQALMAVEDKGLLSRLRTYRDGPRQPKSDKFCRFHNDYGHTIEECRHLKSKIERLIQNRYYKSTPAGKKLEELSHTKSTRRTRARRSRTLALHHKSRMCPGPP
ncbi:UNVERIFIED_CONTAM: hypothetical protein Slati_2652000 [Sesamum latifolium]|uniref:Retrotransposon gag domain-containing protein n=1 Tax=Sesamum latifolium TaxID=2727402 RepID=A0AAW2VV44_9LAMI